MKTRNFYLILGLVALFVCSMAFFATARANGENMVSAANEDIFTNTWLILFLCLAALFALILFFRNFTHLRPENFESFTSLGEVIIKIRALGILSLVLFPLTEYYEALYLGLYPCNWWPVLLTAGISALSLALSFKSNITFRFASLLPQVSYYAVYAIIAYKSLKAGLLPVMAIETACLILFSKLIFTKLRELLYFLVFVAGTNVFLVNLFSYNQVHLDIYISATLQASVVSVALFLIEGSTNRKLGFGGKLLESSGLFVLVADAEARFVYVNKHLEEVTGLGQGQVLGNGWWENMPSDAEQAGQLRQLIKESIQRNKKSSCETKLTGPDGATVYVSWDNTVIEEKYLLLVGKDITASRQLQIEENTRREKAGKYSQVIKDLTTIPFSDAADLEAVFENISRSASRALQVERISIWNYGKDKITCEKLYTLSKNSFESGAELHARDFPVYFSAISHARVVNAPYAYQNIDTKEFAREYFPAHNIKSLLDVPIFINGELKGVLCSEQTDTEKIWDNEDVTFLRAVADFIALSHEASKRRELEREYRYILNNAGDIIYTTDYLGNFNFINTTASNILGYDLASLKGKHFTTIIHPDDREKTALFYLRQFKKRIDSTYLEFKIIDANGHELWVGQNVKLVAEKKDPEKIRGFQAVVRDINKQKQTELALVDSENNFRQLNENIDDLFYLYNFETRRYDYVSPNAATILGVEPSFFYEGNSYTERFVLEEDKAELVKLVESGKIKEVYELEFRVRLNGKIRWIRERSFPIRDEHGRVIKKSGICSDITDRKDKDEQLKQLSLVAQTVSNGVVITNANGLIEWCNESFLRDTEYSFEELLGKRPIDLFSGQDTLPETRQMIKQTMLENGSAEILQYTKSGIPKWFLITNTPLLNAAGHVEKHIEIVTDITERKTLESESRYIINNAGDIIYTTDNRGHVVFLNESVTKILGYGPDELIGRHFTHIVYPEDKRKVVAFYLKQFAKKQEDSYFEFRVLNKYGAVSWVGQNVKLIREVGHSATIKGFQAILRDITRQKETEIALTESENNFRQISEAINDVFYLFDIKEDKYDYISPNAIKILGADAAYFYQVNNYVEDFVYAEDREMVMSAYGSIRDGNTFEIEYRVLIGGETRWIKEKSFVITDSRGEVIKTSGTCIDVTDKKIQEEHLLKVNQELSVTSEDLAINNLLKEQLIYTSDFEEIARVSLNTLKLKIAGIARGSLMLLNETNNSFNVYYVDEEQVKRDTFEFSDMKSYQTLKEGKKYIEYNVDTAARASRSDEERRKEGILSYILLPINYSTELLGALALEFRSPFSLTAREMNILENFTSVLPVVVNKLNLQVELSGRNKDVHDSLNYAKSIQHSILPNLSLHRHNIKSFMALYLPKDVVSGDFYFVESFDDYTVIALGDCTGHGVPGAFITLLGSNFLQRITAENKFTSPAGILEMLDRQLYNSLN